MALIRHEIEIIEHTPYLDTIPSITHQGSRGYFCLHALEDKWIFPFYRFIKLNVDKIFLPENQFTIISTAPYPIIDTNSIEVKTQVAPYKNFPIGIYIRNKSKIPYKVLAGDVIAIFHIVPYMDCHLMELTST